MASNRDPQKDYRTNRRGRKVTSSSDRSKRVKKASAPKPTSSSTRARGAGTGSKQVTSSATRPKGTGAKVTGPKSRVTPKGKGGGNNIRGTATVLAAGALSSGALRHPVSKAKKREAAKSEGKYNTRDADGTVRSRLKVGPKKVGEGKVGTIAQAFDKAYAAAKKDGKKTFTFKGKSYTTK